MATDRRWRNERGFTLIELMVSMTLGLVLLSGVLGIFLSSRATFETTDRLSRIQDSGRFALESIVRDARSAGYLSCSRRAPLTNTLKNSTTVLWNFGLALEGFDAQSGAWNPELKTSTLGITPEPGNDVLVMRIPRGDFEPVRVVAGSLMSATTDDLTTEDKGTTQQLEAGDIVQVSDCNARSIFQVTDNDKGVIAHSATGTDAPGNSSADLGYAFTDAAELIAMESVIYFLDTPEGADVPSLYRRVAGNKGVALDDNDVPVERLVEGVESMQALYGELSGGSVVYRRADQVTNWQNVQTVRIALLVRSTSPYGADVDRGTYTLLDTSVVAPGDRHLRQVFATTVSIRNAIP